MKSQRSKKSKNRSIAYWNTNTRKDSFEILLDSNQICTSCAQTTKFKSCQSIILFSSLFLITILVFYILQRTPDYCVTYKTDESDSAVDINEKNSEHISYNKMVPDVLRRTTVRKIEKANAIDDENKIVFKEDSFQDETQCVPIYNKIKTPVRKSLQKCMEYQSRYVYPCRESATPNEGMVRMNHCNWKPEGLIISGENAYLGEFPHMALLGYDTDDEDQKWKCGGVLISERFVLTAGHCTCTASGLYVTYIRIGIHNKSEKINNRNMYNVQKIIKHKDYKAPSQYNDIALLKTDRVMKLHRNAVPACLHDNSPINDSQIVSIGWGTIYSNQNSYPDTLQKVTLTKFTKKECALHYKGVRYLKHGYDHNTQICYGDKYTNRDTCKGDSGGPNQIKHPHLKCMYLITSITSNSRWCGMRGAPGLYTRVAPYLDWIESIVWPN